MISRLIDTRYELLERLGEGTLFQVYKARDTGSGRVVAIKMLQAGLAHDAAVCGALREAVGRVSGLTHPGIARVEKLVEDDGAPVLVGEFVRGINLKDRIRRIAPFTLSVAVDFGIAVAEALQYAHDHGVAHGDLRPRNIIVSPEGAVKVTDFGLVGVLAASPEAAEASRAQCAPYCPPELASGSLAATDTPSADLYALGVILFEMLTGALPHLGDPVPSPRAVNPAVPRALDGIVAKAALRDPAGRYRSAAELLADLKSVRDALRFGKSLAWSPLEGHAAAAAVKPVEPTRPAAHVPRPAGAAVPAATDAAEAAPAGADRMSTTTTTGTDDSISPILRAMLYVLIFIIMVAGIGFTAFWMATFSKVPEQKFPALKGMKIEAAQQAADKANVRLQEHDEYNENVPAGVIYQSDQPNPGGPIRPGRRINVWVSKGSRFVEVPDLLNLSKDEADAKIKASGIALGTVNRVYSSKIAFDHIIAQNPRPRKRVTRDVLLNLTISDGPNPDEAPPPTPDNADSGGGADSGANPGNLDNGGAPNPGDQTGADTGNGSGSGGTGALSPEDQARLGEVHTVNLTKRIPHDGMGSRRVRIEYDDAQGTHTPVDETRDEGATVTQRVDVYGPRITVRVFYGDDPQPVSTRTMEFPKPRE